MNLEHPPAEIAYSLRRFHVDRFHFEQAKHIDPSWKILDLGGNRTRKRGYFDLDSFSGNVLYVNLSTAKSPHVASDAAALPFVPEAFDLVICAELLEHVPYPPAVLEEVARVLKKGGLLWVCVPFLVEVHADPYDFGRYTAYQWERWLAEAGFTVGQLERQGGFFTVLAYLISQWIFHLHKHGRFGALTTGLLVRFAHWLKKKAVDKDAARPADPFYDAFTTGYGIVARKW